jgi:hypothetical protein
MDWIIKLKLKFIQKQILKVKIKENKIKIKRIILKKYTKF